jgi:hypothetical protein
MITSVTGAKASSKLEDYLNLQFELPGLERWPAIEAFALSRSTEFN